MSNLAIYTLVIVVYMGVLLAAGMWTSRRTKSAEDFYIGGTAASAPWVTAFSFVAAYFSSVVIVGGGAFGYRFGMSTIWVGAVNVLVGCTLAGSSSGRRLWHFTKRSTR